MKPTPAQIAGWERRAVMHESDADRKEMLGHYGVAAHHRREAANLRRAAAAARQEMEQETV